VERQSGGQISDAYVSRIENGYILNVSPKKLKALAKGLHRTYEEVRAKADGVLVENEEQFEKSEIAALFYDSKSLSDKDQQELQVIWDMLKQDIRRRKQKQNPKR
jgi:transcriptional regulator with XRE-family HTH domain